MKTTFGELPPLARFRFPIYPNDRGSFQRIDFQSYARLDERGNMVAFPFTCSTSSIVELLDTPAPKWEPMGWFGGEQETSYA